MKSDEGKPARRSIQFSIKTILILTLVVAAYFAGKIPEQRRAQEAIMEARVQAERAAAAEQEARMVADKSLQQAQGALQRALQAEAQAKLAAEGEAASFTDR